MMVKKYEKRQEIFISKQKVKQFLSSKRTISEQSSRKYNKVYREIFGTIIISKKITNKHNKFIE